MGSTDTPRPSAAIRSNDAAIRRWLTPLPLVALVLSMTIVALLAYQRNGEIRSEQDAQDNGAKQEFIAEVESTLQQTQSEVDRLTELTMGIRAFVSSSSADELTAVTDYLQLSGASARFEGMSAIYVLGANDTALSETRVASGTSRELPVRTPGPENVTLVAEIRNRTSLDTFVTTVPSADVPTVAVAFPLGSGTSGSTTVGWAALLFPEETFLSRALTRPGATTSTLLRVDETPVIDGLVGEPTNVQVLKAPDAALTATTALDVFGTRFDVVSVTEPGFVETVSRSEVYILLFAGGAASLGLYAALSGLIAARARAIETARTATAARAAVDRRFQTSFESSPIGMAEIDSLGRLVAVNEAMCRQIGEHRETILGRPLSSLVHEADRQAHLERIELLLNGEADSAQGEHRYRQGTDREIWVSESVSVIESDARGPRSMLVQSQDVTAQRRAAWELAQQALHDDLTGLPNRALFLNRLKHSLERRRRAGGYLAVMFIDIDRFKVINDSLGHEMGDAFLVQIAERIGTALRTGDTVARFGGDEFVVLCEEVSSDSEALAVAQRIQGSFKEPFMLGDTATHASSSIGITLSNGIDDTADSLLRDADAAMYRAKEGGRNRTEVFDHTMRSTVVARMEIESQLRDALENGEIVMHYMAIVDPTSFQPSGYEALIRWNHPEKGLLGPGAFLGVAEEAGLIGLVDAFALRHTCQQIAKWVQEYPAAEDIYLATNWSARHLGRFVQQVEQVLAETAIDPRHLVIEVTEGFLLEDSDGSLVALQELKELGVRIAIDDFGTGYSSLAYLTRFDVDFLKIDQSFVSKLPDDTASAAVIGAIADMASRLDIGLVAEGVETDEQIEMLNQLGSPSMQGYRFAKPRPAADIEYQLEVRSNQLAETAERFVTVGGS